MWVRFPLEIYVNVMHSYVFFRGFCYFRNLVSSCSRRSSQRGHCRICIRNGTLYARVRVQSTIAFRLHVLSIAVCSASATVVARLIRSIRRALPLNECAYILSSAIVTGMQGTFLYSLSFTSLLELKCVLQLSQTLLGSRRLLFVFLLLFMTHSLSGVLKSSCVLSSIDPWKNHRVL